MIYATRRQETFPPEKTAFGRLQSVVIDFLLGDPSTKIYQYQYEDILQSVDIDDAIGVNNWEKVLDENSAYYLFKNDVDIIARHAEDIAKSCHYTSTVIELAIGGEKAISHKTIPMIRALKPHKFIANDISAAATAKAKELVGQSFPYIYFEEAVCDYHDQGEKIYNYTDATVILAGSSISNITSGNQTLPIHQVIEFIKMIGRMAGKKGNLIITQDTNQDEKSLLAAYHTNGFAQFRLGTLHRIQRALNIEGLDPASFVPMSFWHPEHFLVSNTLICQKDQTVFLNGIRIFIPKGKKLYVSNSHRYPADFFLNLCARSGFRPKETFFDHENRLATHILQSV